MTYQKRKVCSVLVVVLGDISKFFGESKRITNGNVITHNITVTHTKTTTTTRILTGFSVCCYSTSAREKSTGLCMYSADDPFLGG